MQTIVNCDAINTMMIIIVSLPVFWVLNALILHRTSGALLRELCSWQLLFAGGAGTVLCILDLFLAGLPELRAISPIRKIINNLNMYITRARSTDAGLADWLGNLAILAGNIAASMLMINLSTVEQTTPYQQLSQFTLEHMTTYVTDTSQCTDTRIPAEVWSQFEIQSNDAVWMCVLAADTTAADPNSGDTQWQVLLPAQVYSSFVVANRVPDSGVAIEDQALDRALVRVNALPSGYRVTLSLMNHQYYIRYGNSQFESMTLINRAGDRQDIPLSGGRGHFIVNTGQITTLDEGYPLPARCGA
jgi:hypothetical protein